MPKAYTPGRKRGKNKEVSIRSKSYDMSKALKLRMTKHLSYDQIGELLGVTGPTIRTGLKDIEVLLDRPALTSAFRESEAEITDSIRLLAVQAIGEQLNDPKRRKKLDLLRLNNLYGTLFDKSRLLRGESTSNLNTLSRVIEEAHRADAARDVTDSPITPEDPES